MEKTIPGDGVLRGLLCAATLLLPLGVGWQHPQQGDDAPGMGSRPGVVLETAVKHLSVSNPGQPESGAGFTLTQKSHSHVYTNTNQQRLNLATSTAGRQTLLAYGRLQLEGG